MKRNPKIFYIVILLVLCRAALAYCYLLFNVYHTIHIEPLQQLRITSTQLSTYRMCIIQFYNLIFLNMNCYLLLYSVIVLAYNFDD